MVDRTIISMETRNDDNDSDNEDDNDDDDADDNNDSFLFPLNSEISATQLLLAFATHSPFR